MNRKSTLIILIATICAVVVIVALTLMLTPEKTNPAFKTATDFMNAAGTGDADAAYALLSPEMQDYVTDNCPNGNVSDCILSYTPPEWGRLNGEGAAVYRRSIQDGDAWDIQLIATYEEGDGFSGVCIYHRVEEIATDDWRVTAWAGFITCDEANAGLDRLRRENAPNRAP
jgi:hypothetical protein